MLLCWQKNKISALVSYQQSSRAERQLRKISLHLFIDFFIGHFQPGWTLVNPAQQQALSVSCNAMTTQHQQFSISTKKLYLTKGRLAKYYFDTFILGGLTLLISVIISKGVITKVGHNSSPYFLLFLFFPVLTIISYLNLRRELRLTELKTGLSKHDNYKTTKETLKTLGWHIKVDNKGFIEAYTDNFGVWTWTDQMISIFLEDNKIMYNSVCNVDTFATQAFSWGQNTRNKKQFADTFELILTRQSS